MPTLGALAALTVSLVVAVLRLEWFVKHHVYYLPVTGLGVSAASVVAWLGTRFSGLKLWTPSDWRPSPRPALLLALSPVPLLLGVLVPPYALAIRNGTPLTVKIADVDAKPEDVCTWWPSGGDLSELPRRVTDYGARFCAVGADGGPLGDAGPCKPSAKGPIDLPVFGAPGAIATLGCRGTPLPPGSASTRALATIRAPCRSRAARATPTRRPP